MNSTEQTLFDRGQQIRSSVPWVSVPGLSYLERKGDEIIPFTLTSLDILAGKDVSIDTAPDTSSRSVAIHISSILKPRVTIPARERQCN